MEFRVLGPVEVYAAGQRVDAGHARQRAVLAVLLLELGRVVPAEQLIERVRGDDPPASVRNALYGHVARLRAAFADAGEPEIVLARRAGGYVLEAPAQQVDVNEFRRLAGEAAASGNAERAAGLLRSAVSLWRGTPLAGLGGRWLEGMRGALELERRAARLDLNDLGLRLGRHGALVSDLSEAAAAFPTDERLAGQLMLALYRCGRQADALLWFERTRLLLADELGADPGLALRELHQQILRADSSLDIPGGGPVRSGGVTPMELPGDVPAFTGRVAELAELDELLAGSADSGAVAVAAVSGTAGVGKTALALRWAHRAAGQFPDGQLYVNLRGYDPGPPMPAADALAGFLRALGLADEDIPAGLDDRAARYRSLLAGRRMLVVLDNTSEVEQVRPLLPGAPGCRTVVTSRDALAGLVARDGAKRVGLDLLPAAEAVTLLRVLVGARVDADQRAAAVLADQCARLPLALRVAAEFAAARPALALAELAGELADQQRRLDLLDAGGDPRTAVRAVLSWSCRHLDAGAARVFRLLGLHPGPDFEPYAVAALADIAARQASQVLDTLARAHLIQPAGPGRYGLHDLLRAYARDLAGQDDEQDRRAALTRLFDHYLHTAAAAMDTLFPAEQHSRPVIRAPEGAGPPVTDPAAARTWLDQQRTSLVAEAAYTAAHGWPRHTTLLATTMYRYLDMGCYFLDGLRIHGDALRAARQAGDRAAEATALINLGVAYMRHGRLRQAAGHTQQALRLCRESGDQDGLGRALANLGIIEWRQGRYQQAVDYQQQALVVHRGNGRRLSEARVITNLGAVYRLQGCHQQAADYHRQALAIFGELGDRAGETVALNHLGEAEIDQGRYAHATSSFRQSLALCRAISNREGMAYALEGLGRVELRRQRYQQAVSPIRQALALHRQSKDRIGEVEVLNDLGEVLLATGRPGQAQAMHATALGRARQIEDWYEQARAHAGLARSHPAEDTGQSRRHWQEALSIYARLGVPQADHARAQVAACSQGPDPRPIMRRAAYGDGRRILRFAGQGAGRRPGGDPRRPAGSCTGYSGCQVCPSSLIFRTMAAVDTSARRGPAGEASSRMAPQPGMRGAAWLTSRPATARRSSTRTGGPGNRSSSATGGRCRPTTGTPRCCSSCTAGSG